MTTTATRPDSLEAGSRRREHRHATASLVVGIAVSVGGIALLVVTLLVYLSFGDHPSDQLGFGTLLVAAGAFAISAWGTDVRHRALTARKAIREKTASPE